jgi:hypothetical protein
VRLFTLIKKNLVYHNELMSDLFVYLFLAQQTSVGQGLLIY